MKSTSELLNVWAGEKVESVEQLEHELEIIQNLNTEFHNVYLALKTALVLITRTTDLNEATQKDLQKYLKHIDSRIKYYKGSKSIDPLNILPI